MREELTPDKGPIEEKSSSGDSPNFFTRGYRFFREILNSESGHWFSLTCLSLIFGLLLVTLEAYGVSPLYYQANLLSYDPDMYKTFGAMMVEGAIPYVDILDIKGPYLFFYSYLAALISYQWGAYILQWLVASVAFLLTFDTLRRLGLTGRYRFACLGVFAIFSGIMMEGHNADDSMLELLCLTTWALVIALKSDNPWSRSLASLSVGLAAGILVFTRATSASLCLGCAVILIAILIHRKDYRGIWLYTLIPGFIGAAITLSIPFIYYGTIGEIPALIEWNFTRPLTYFTSHGYSWERWMSLGFTLALFICEGIPLYRIRKAVPGEHLAVASFLLIFQTIVSLAFYVSMRHMRGGLPAYLLVAGLPLIFSQEKFTKSKEIATPAIAEPTSEAAQPMEGLIHSKRGLIPLIIACGFLPALLLFSIGFTTYVYAGEAYRIAKSLYSLRETIPEKDRASGKILAVDLPAGVYQNVGAVPTFAVPCLQSWNESFIPDMEELVVSYIRNKATWVIVNGRPYEHPEITPIYQRKRMMQALKDLFEYRNDLSYEGTYLVYERV